MLACLCGWPGTFRVPSEHRHAWAGRSSRSAEYRDEIRPIQHVAERHHDFRLWRFSDWARFSSDGMAQTETLLVGASRRPSFVNYIPSWLRSYEALTVLV